MSLCVCVCGGGGGYKSEDRKSFRLNQIFPPINHNNIDISHNTQPTEYSNFFVVIQTSTKKKDFLLSVVKGNSTIPSRTAKWLADVSRYVNQRRYVSGWWTDWRPVLHHVYHHAGMPGCRFQQWGRSLFHSHHAGPAVWSADGIYRGLSRQETPSHLWWVEHTVVLREKQSIRFWDYWIKLIYNDTVLATDTPMYKSLLLENSCAR